MSTGVLMAGTLGCWTQEPVSSEAAPDRPEQTMVDVAMNLTGDGARRGLVAAESAFVFQESRRFEFRRLRTTLFDDDGRSVAVLTAPLGVYLVPAGVLELIGDVTVATITGDSLITPALSFDLATRELRTDSAYRHRTASGTRSGTGWRSGITLRPVPARRPNR